MSNITEKKKKASNLESELYLLIAKFLSTGPCKESAELLRKEIEKYELLPKRVDWLGNEHIRTFEEFDNILSQIGDDHLLKVCARVGPILDKEIPPTVSGLTSLLGVGRQSLLRTKEDLLKPKCQMSNLMARKNGMPLFPSHAVQSTYPPNIAQVLISRETSGSLSTRHTFTPKVYARQQLYRRLLGHLSSVYCVLFDRTGKYIFTGADDLLVKVWNALDGRLLSALRGHSAEITDMAVNHENTLLAAGSCDKTIRVWCLRTTAPVAVLSGHTGMVTSLQFCPYPKNDERLLISTGNDGCVCFWHWNPKTNAFNPKPLRFTERNKANAQMICSSFSSGGLFLATGSTDNNVRVYNIAGTNGPEKILEREVHTDRVDSLQFSNRDCRFISGSKDGTALIWKYERQNWTSITLKMSTKLPGQSEEPEDTKTKLRVTMVGWTLDDDRVITAVSDHTIKVWNSYSGNLCYILKGHEDEVFVLEPHPTDSRVFLSSGHDGRIIIWDLVTGTIIKNHFNLIEGQGHGAVFDCKFSPDGLSFASTDSHGHLSIFGFGSVERYKKVPEEQFFHTDYRPLIRDIHHHVLDEQTQTAPHLLPPPFLVDIDGNPYPPNFQRLVPGREHHNDSQLVPYVAVSAEGESEVFEPVRPANDGPSDRPTIDDMIERLQQERNQNNDNDLASQMLSTDSARSPHSSHRSVNGNGERRAADPQFSPRTPRSQAGHSRVGLRRTGDVEGVQSVGNWQSRGSDANSTSKRVVVRPMKPSMFKHALRIRTGIADYELSFFNKEKKKRALPEKFEISRNTNETEKKRSGNRAGLRSRAQEDSSNNAFEDEENPDTTQTSPSDSETEQENNDETTDQSDSDYSDWTENNKEAKETRSKAKATSQNQPRPSTSGVTRRSASARQIKAPRRLVSSGDEEDGDSDDPTKDEDDEESHTSGSPVRKPKRKPPTPKKKTAVNGKKLPERFRPPEWLTDVTPHKAPYVPQIGDEVLYFRQGHELYVQAVKRNRIYDIYMRSQPWRTINLRDQEVARIDDITFENHPPRLCCLQLTLTNPASKYDETFTVKYHDMADVIDFIVLKQNYDQAMYYDWKPGDRFRSAIDKAWWLGTIKSQKPLNPNFPDSMFQCFMVKWDNGEKEHMSPWDFEPIDNERLPSEEGGSVDIVPEERLAMMYVPEPDEWSEYGRDHDCDRIARGLTRIMELGIAESFTSPVDLNLYPSYAIVVEYPMDLGTIKARVQNRFYRRLDAVKFDVRYIELNAQKFNEPASRIVKQAKCVVDLCIKFINAHYCSDPMVFYNEMMEAKQSRSQDSQSELDVLCSEMDSDGEASTSTRIKRKKQNSLQHSSKRVRLGNQKYTSSSWRQQASDLLNNFFQCDDSTPFRQPVNLNDYPDYRNIIDIPMDLSTVREKLNNNIYSSPIDFCKDMRMIFQNSRNYNTNKKSRIYSMTIRLSAMFEEHIRSIVGDWRSAVKYEEKIRNNQYVSSRRKPLPVQEPGINVGASTSRGTSSMSSSSRAESSRHSVGRALNNLGEIGSSNGHSSKLSNGNGPRKKIKHGDSHSSKGSSVKLNKKKLKTQLGTVNGFPKHTQVSKRKMSDRSPRKHSERTRKVKSYNEEFSLSETNSSNSASENNESGDGDWGHSSKKRKKDSGSQKNLKPKKSLPVKKSTRPTRSSAYHQTSSLYSSLRSSIIRSRSSSPEDVKLNTLKKKVTNNYSPLQTRSERLRNKPRRTYHDSGDSSDSESEEQNEKNSSSGSSSKQVVSEKNSRRQIETRTTRSSQPVNEDSNSSCSLSKFTQGNSRVLERSSRRQAVSETKSRRSIQPVYEDSNSFGSSSKSSPDDSRLVNERSSRRQAASETRSRRSVPPVNEDSNKSQPYSSSQDEEEEDEISEDEQEDYEGSEEDYAKPRKMKRNARVSVLPARYRSLVPKKPGRIQTRNRGQRTVQYQEGDSEEEEPENASLSRRHNSRSLRSQAYGDEQNLGIPKGANENEGCTAKASSLVDKELYLSSATQSSSNHNLKKGLQLGIGLDPSRMNRQKSSFQHGSHTLYALKSETTSVVKSNRKVMSHRVFSVSNKNGPATRNKESSISYSLRKCSELIKKSLIKPGITVFRKPDALPKSCNVTQQSKLGLKDAKSLGSTFSKKLKDSGVAASTGVLSTRSKVLQSNTITQKSNTVLLRSHHQLSLKKSINSKEFPNRTQDRIGKPTIIFCKPTSSNAFIDGKSKMKANVETDCDSENKLCLSVKGIENSKSNVATKDSSTLKARAISSHTRSASPRFLKPSSSVCYGPKKGRSLSAKLLAKAKGNYSCKDTKKLSVASSSKTSKNSSCILENNKSKWCLRKPNLPPRIYNRMSQSLPHSNKTGSRKVQTRNQGQRTVVYNEDSDNNYLTEILENEDPVKLKRRHSHNPATVSKDSVNASSPNQFVEKSTSNCGSSASNSKQSASKTLLRPKKAFKILSNGIETRNHGQRTTMYAEDGDDYLEEYFANFDL